jgi:hypothetical protein
MYISSGTQSTSTTTGALRVAGGVGIVKNLHVGGTFNVSGTSAFAGTITGATVNAGTIGNAGATLTGTLSTAAQTNITSVGSLSSLTVGGATSLNTLTMSGTVTLAGAPSTTLQAATKGYVDTAISTGISGISIPTVPTKLSQFTNDVPFYKSGDAPSFGATATGALTVTGAITATGDITAFASDIRLKDEILDIENALDKVKSLKGFTYKFNELAVSLGFDGNQRHLGVSAQDVLAVMPTVVKPAPANSEYLTVQYDKLVALLIEAIKELSREVENLKTKL